MTITITYDLRPCVADGEKALFHRWENYSEVVGESPMIGGHAAGQISCCLGLVELEDGTMKRVQVDRIRFLDNVMRKYAFGNCECE